MPKLSKSVSNSAGLRQSAESRLREREARPPPPDADERRTFHELQVHQIELEMQNAELQEATARAESALDKYTDLYDFAPVSYFSLDTQGVILDANLSASSLLGVEISRLLHRCLPDFAASEDRPLLLSFIKKVFGLAGRHAVEIPLRDVHGNVFVADLQATASTAPVEDARRWCRLAVSDITALRRAEEAQRHVEELAAANQKLEEEITRRKAVESALTEGERHQRLLRKRSEQMQGQMRDLSRRLLDAQEEERRRISRELHDEVLQTLVGISVHLENLGREAQRDISSLKPKIIEAQRLVTDSVKAIHQFARELRPLILDDLGLVPALDSYIMDFRKRMAIDVQFSSFPEVEQLSCARRTALYRVVQAALANTAKHAAARRVKVTIHDGGASVHLIVQDDGCSFDVVRTLHVKRYNRLGLLGMRERVEMVGGRFGIESTPGHGTTIRAEIPKEDKVIRKTRREHALR